MRTFENLPEAISEIRRDLYKSPRLISTRVQQFEIEGGAEVAEALCYNYTIKEMPKSLSELTDIAQRYSLLTSSEIEGWAGWIDNEAEARLGWQAGAITERFHPILRRTLEGDEPSYTYTDRLAGAFGALVNALETSEDSRRAFWPIFNQEDSRRASRLTRIPCSIGYQALIRQLGGEEKFLHLVYLQRSCDFDKFWLSDLWLAHYFQWALSEVLGVKLGFLTHSIISFHSFINGEVY